MFSISPIPFHADLKPENLLLASKDNDTDVKIADFGFAKHVSEKLNTVCGTPGNTHSFNPQTQEVCGVLFFFCVCEFSIISSVALTIFFFHFFFFSLVCVCVCVFFSPTLKTRLHRS
jgi:hypothetical protein